MSRLKMYVIECDGHIGEGGCRDSSLVNLCETKKEAEAEAVREGWKLGARDLCPVCVERESEPIVTQAGYLALVMLTQGDVVRTGPIHVNAFNRLVRQGFAIRVGDEVDEFTWDRRPYRITDTGRKALVEGAEYWG